MNQPDVNVNLQMFFVTTENFPQHYLGAKLLGHVLSVCFTLLTETNISVVFEKEFIQHLTEDKGPEVSLSVCSDILLQNP